VSAKEYLYGRKRRPPRGRDGTRTALYLRVSTPDQKPDLQYDGLRAYAQRAGLDVIEDFCDVGVSGRREGRPQLNALMAAARRPQDRLRSGLEVRPLRPQHEPFVDGA
jgi:predicted site-specific integrase-resolvase